MAVTSHVYTMAAKSLVDKLMDLDSDSLYVMLLSAYTVGTGHDTHQFLSDVLAVGTQSVGTGYTANGQALGSVTFARAGSVYTLDCADPSWSAVGGSLAAAYAVFYDRTPATDAARPVFCYWDLGGTQTATNGAFGLTIDAAGLMTFTAV